MSVIDIEELLREIAADAPCGEDLEYDPAFAGLEKLAQETPERQYGETIIPAEPPDWRGVKQMALTLLERSRDLRVAVYLTRALLHVDGLAGFAEGLALVDGLIERYWDSVFPRLDPEDNNDPTLRVNTIVALCDLETILWTLRETPLVRSPKLGQFSLRDVQIASGALTPVVADKQVELPTLARIDGAFQDADLQALRTTAGWIASAVGQVERIETVLTDRIGVTQAPDLSKLTGVLKEMRQVLAVQLQRRGGEPVVEPLLAGTVADLELPAGVATAVVEQRAVVGEITSREDVIRLLDKLCEYFNRYEPSSPVPLLLKRARTLATKDFMGILLDLAPGGAEQAKLILGVQDKISD
jgi:type VI secretion system protein ImpA